MLFCSGAFSPYFLPGRYLGVQCQLSSPVSYYSLENSLDASWLLGLHCPPAGFLQSTSPDAFHKAKLSSHAFPLQLLCFHYPRLIQSPLKAKPSPSSYASLLPSNTLDFWYVCRKCWVELCLQKNLQLHPCFTDEVFPLLKGRFL